MRKSNAYFRALENVESHRLWAALCAFYEPKAAKEHIRKARTWLEAAKEIRQMR
jgi:hypothetical protein